MRVERQGECLIWLGPFYYSRSGARYPRLGATVVHRLMYEIHVGPIPEGYEVDHVAARGCTSTLCVNWQHLEAVTPGENQARSALALSRRPVIPGLGTCRKGHEYTTISKRGWKVCPTCNADRQRRLRERRRKKITRSN